MSDIYGTTSTPEDATRQPGTVDVSPAPGTDPYGTDSHGTDSPVVDGTTGTTDTKQVAKDEAIATGQQAKDGAKHVAEVGKDEVKNVVQESGQQAKELWQQTRSQLLDQSAQQQTKVAEGLRSLSQELSGMARGSEQQGVASDLAQQASQRMGDVAGWLDQRDPGSLVSEVKQFARQRPGAFLATAAVIGLVGGRLSRGLVADHQDQKTEDGATADPAAYGGTHTGAANGTHTGSHTATRPTDIADPDAFPA